MKVIDITFKDLKRSFRSAFAVVFMFGVPLLVTGMFYFMFGNIARGGEFNLPQTKAIVANLDEGGPRFRVRPKDIPGSSNVHTMGELVLSVLQSEEMSDLVEISHAPSAAAARAAVDTQAAQVAIIIPADFSRQFADPYGQAAIEFYQDPTLTIGPDIIHAILNRFMDGMAGVKIALDVFMDSASTGDYFRVEEYIQQYLDASQTQTEDLESALLRTERPANAPQSDNLLLRIISPIMGGMMIFYAFFTGASAAQSIIKEEEERTLPRLFTTPTPQVAILTGKFLAVFLTVLVQVTVLLIVAQWIFGIHWGSLESVLLSGAGIVLMAASFGIFINSFLKSTRQGGMVFGGALVISGMVGMISIFDMSSPTAARLGDTVSLLVPQGWAVRGLLQAMEGAPARELWATGLVMLSWSVAFFALGVWRFNKRYR